MNQPALNQPTEANAVSGSAQTDTGAAMPPPGTAAPQEVQAPQAAPVDATDPAKDNNIMRTSYRQLSKEEQTAMVVIKNQGNILWHEINGLGESREISLAKTKIEEAVMWAVKHITG